MLDKLFKDIATEENATLEILEKVLDTGDGSRLPYYVYLMHLTYKGASIKFINNVGTQFYGYVTCDFQETLKNLDFEITTRSHFISLFKKNNERIKLITKSAKVNSFLKQSSAFRELTKISNHTAFEPWLIGQNIDDKYNITTKYSLQFEGWKQSIRPMLRFQKELIDYFKD